MERNNVLKKILDHLLPQFCGVCGAEGAVVCDACIRTIPFSISSATSVAPLDALFFSCSYDHRVAQEMVRACKYDGLRQVGRSMGELLAYAWMHGSAPRPEVDVVMPVPLHGKRLAERGFNQAEEIARTFCELTGSSLNTSCVQRTRATKRQVDLGESERSANVAGAFSIIGAVPSRVLVLDDVITTGSTCAAIAGALKSAGATSVIGLAFAKG